MKEKLDISYEKKAVFFLNILYFVLLHKRYIVERFKSILKSDTSYVNEESLLYF